jgi:hypothetical protein
MKSIELKSNQLPITKDVPTDRLRTLEKRARKRLAYFTGKQNFHSKIYDIQMTSNRPVNNENFFQLMQARVYATFWENRLNSITDELTERYLLQD